MGYAIYLLPEAATLFINAGADFLTPDPNLSYVTEKAKLQFQLQMEDSMEQIAKACDKPVLMVCDRGAMDTAAYMSMSVWQDMKDDLGMTESTLRDKRYNAVIHLCTVAKGVEEVYTRKNNHCRSENVEKARSVDDCLIRVWQGHPRFHVVQAEATFDVKAAKVFEIIDSYLK